MSRMNLGNYDKLNDTAEDYRKRKKPVPGMTSNMANKDGPRTPQPQPAFGNMANREGGYRPPVQQAPTQEQQGPQDIGPAALREQFDMEQQKFIRDKQAGLIKFGSPEDLAGRQRLFGLSDERKQYDLAARAPTTPLSPEQNAANSQRASGQAAEVIGQDINRARAAGQNTSEMEARLSGLQQKNIGMTREEAIASGLKMAGGTGMGGMLAAGQDVQEGLKSVAPAWMAKGDEYTAMQRNRVGKDVEASQRAAGRAGDMTAARNDGEAYARDMATGERDIGRAMQEAQLYQLRRAATDTPEPQDAEKVRGERLKNDLLEAQVGELKGKISNPVSSENIILKGQHEKAAWDAAGLSTNEVDQIKRTLSEMRDGSFDSSGNVIPGNAKATDDLARVMPGFLQKLQNAIANGSETAKQTLTEIIDFMPEPNASGEYGVTDPRDPLRGIRGLFNMAQSIVNPAAGAVTMAGASNAAANLPKSVGAAKRMSEMRREAEAMRRTGR